MTKPTSLSPLAWVSIVLLVGTVLVAVAIKALRAGKGLSREVVVVRFGETSAKAFFESVRIEAARRRKRGVNPIWGLSVVSAPQMTADELVFRTKEWPGLEDRGLPHGKIQESTVAAILNRGYEVVPDEPPACHALVLFKQEPTDVDRVNLLDAFGPLRPSPLLSTPTGNEEDRKDD